MHTTGASIVPSSHKSYRAIVRFTDSRNATVAIVDSFAFKQPSFNLGRSVKVFYDPIIPQNAMIDRGKMNYVFFGLGCGLAGLMLIGGFQRLSRSDRPHR